MKPGAVRKMSPKVIEEVALHNQVIVTT